LSKITDTVLQLIHPAINAMGYSIVDVEYIKEGQDKMLNIYITKPGGIFIEDCEKVSRVIDPIIEEADPISEAYILCVSSPGADRPLKTPGDFERNIDKEVEINLYSALDGSKHIVGTLLQYTDADQTVFIKSAGKEYSIKLKDISRIRPYITI